MPDTAIAQRYALALMDIADEAKAIDQILADLEHFSALLAAENGMLAQAFANPGVTKEEREGLLKEVFGLFKPHEQSRNVLSLLNMKGRLNHCEHHQRIPHRDDRAGRVPVLAETAEPLTPELEIEIKEALKASTGKEIVLEKRHVLKPTADSSHMSAARSSTRRSAHTCHTFVPLSFGRVVPVFRNLSF